MPRSDFHGRWLLAREALLAQGFPVSADLTANVPCCSFAVPGRDDTMSRTAQIGQAGNAMNAMVCAVSLLFAISQVEAAPPPRIVSSLFGAFAQQLSLSIC